MENGLSTLLKKLHKLLFDFSASENNRREVEDILVAVLTESKGDEDFLRVLRRVVLAYEGDSVEGEDRWYSFRRFMTRNRRRSDRSVGIRARAEHLLEDLPRIYGGKNKQSPSPLCPQMSTANDANTKEDNPDA